MPSSSSVNIFLFACLYPIYPRSKSIQLAIQKYEDEKNRSDDEQANKEPGLKYENIVTMPDPALDSL